MKACFATQHRAAGYRLVVCDRNQEAVERLQKAGAKAADTPAALAATPGAQRMLTALLCMHLAARSAADQRGLHRSPSSLAHLLALPCSDPPPSYALPPAGLSAIISMLPSSEHVRAAYLGPQGILSLEPGQLHPHLLVDCSTIDPITAKEVATAAADSYLHLHAAEAHDGQRNPMMIDAPVSGGVPGAQAGSLTFMVGWGGRGLGRSSLAPDGDCASMPLAELACCAQSATPHRAPLCHENRWLLQCGGPQAAVDAARPLLEVMGKRIMHCKQRPSCLLPCFRVLDTACSASRAHRVRARCLQALPRCVHLHLHDHCTCLQAASTALARPPSCATIWCWLSAWRGCPRGWRWASGWAWCAGSQPRGCVACAGDYVSSQLAAHSWRATCRLVLVGWG